MTRKTKMRLLYEISWCKIWISDSQKKIRCEVPMTTIRVYTQPIEAFYPEGLARAIHFSIQQGGACIPLNGGYPLLFAQGEIGADNSIVPKNLMDPTIAKTAEGYVICARQVDEATSVPGRMEAWRTTDFLSFQSCEPVPATETELPIPEEIAQAAIERWVPLHSVAVEVPKQFQAASVEELSQVRATVTYSDGSTHEKRVAWDASQVDFATPGEYPVTGKVQARSFGFPLTEDTGDPVLLRQDGWWYFISTNDANGNIGLHIRRAHILEDLFREGKYERSVILDYDEERAFIQTFWAPEFHRIGGKLYILFAVGGKVWGPQCHIMALKEGGDIFSPEGWEVPRPMVRADGSALCPDGITLDMTYLHTPGGNYVVWSSRYNCMKPGDSGSMLSIARVNEETPWQLASEPVLLTRPLLGFENMAGTINNEGPYALMHGGKVYLIYSGGAANGYTYDLGQMSADENADLTDLTSWTKVSTAVLHFRSMPGVYGPGHHSFFEADGETFIAYHGVVTIDGHTRCAGIHRVHFDKLDRPRFDLCRERDLAAELENVTATVIVR